MNWSSVGQLGEGFHERVEKKVQSGVESGISRVQEQRGALGCRRCNNKNVSTGNPTLEQVKQTIRGLTLWSLAARPQFLGLEAYFHYLEVAYWISVLAKTELLGSAEENGDLAKE